MEQISKVEVKVDKGLKTCRDFRGEKNAPEVNCCSLTSTDTGQNKASSSFLNKLFRCFHRYYLNASCKYQHSITFNGYEGRAGES